MVWVDIIFILAIIIWVIELYILYREAEAEQIDPLSRVAGAAIFFVLALPVAHSYPDLVDRIGGFWAGFASSFGGGHGRRRANTPRLMVDGQPVLLTAERTTIGRYPNNDIVLDHPTVSAYHAEVLLRPDGQHELIDHESKNGTRVNGDQVREAILHDGDAVQIGARTLHYLRGDRVPSPAPDWDDDVPVAQHRP